MTALTEYQRLEAAGLWRETPQSQRRDVIVSIGEATLILSDTSDRPLTHWSLPALVRANPGEFPALYHPDGDPGETLELAAEETDMIAALEKLRTVIDKRRPHPGRLRLVLLAAMCLAIVLGGLFWLPSALRGHVVNVVPQVKREAIGAALAEEIARVSGPPCGENDGQVALDKLANRVATDDRPLTLRVVRQGVDGALLLPGRQVLLNRALIEDYEEPDVAAGYALAELLHADSHDPLADMLDTAGLGASFRLLTTGEVPEDALRAYAEHLVTRPRPQPETEALLDLFEEAQVRSSPYAYALDITGESVLTLIEADPFANAAPPPLLSDGDWLRLQSICGG